MKRHLWPIALLLASAGIVWAQAGNEEGTTATGAVHPISKSQLTQTDDSSLNATDPQNPVAPSQERSRSYLLIGVHASQGVETDPSGVSGYSSQLSPVTDLFGNVRLLKLKRCSETAFDYVGGGSLYNAYGNFGSYEQQSQQAAVEQSFRWKRRRLVIRDWFSYVGEGNLGPPSLGNTGADNLRFTDAAFDLSGNMRVYDSHSGLPSGADLTSFPFNTTYITNISDVTLIQAFTPRSSVYATGDYTLTQYLGSSQTFLDSRQVSAMTGFNYQLTRRQSIGVLYGYQNFRFPSARVGTVLTNSLQVTFQRSLSARMNLSVGMGPEFVSLHNNSTSPSQVNASGQANMLYAWAKSSIQGSYNRSVTAGSGLFAGATTDSVSFSFGRTFLRSWHAGLSGGYVRSKDIGGASGLSGNSLSYGMGSITARRAFTRALSGFMSYQFEGENISGCGVSQGCDAHVRRHLVRIGLDFYFRPRRLD